MPTRREDFVLSYPFTSPTITVTIKPPAWGDIERLKFTRIYRKTRGKVIRSFSDPQWPTEDTLTWRFVWLSLDEKNEIKALLVAAIGQEIRVRDHEDVTWKGIILNPNAEFTTIGRNCDDEEAYAIELELLGEKQ